jgi:hypothetical protein
MAEKATKVNAPEEKMVEIELFYDGERYKDDVPVILNGKAFLIKRGERVKVPEAYAEIIRNSLKQNALAADMMNKLQRDFFENNKTI